MLCCLVFFLESIKSLDRGQCIHSKYRHFSSKKTLLKRASIRCCELFPRVILAEQFVPLTAESANTGRRSRVIITLKYGGCPVCPGRVADLSSPPSLPLFWGHRPSTSALRFFLPWAVSSVILQGVVNPALRLLPLISPFSKVKIALLIRQFWRIYNP